MRRVRLLEPDGTEHLVTPPTSEEQVLRLAAVVYAAETADAAPAAAAAPSPAAAASLAAAEPVEAAYAAAVECVLKARAELEPILDIIAHLETNEHISIVEVQRPSAKVETLIADLAVRAQSKYSEIATASATLRRASVAARSAAERSQRFYAELAQLQHAARLLRAPDAAVASGAAFMFDVGFPGLAAPPAEVQLLVGPSPDTGSIRTLGAPPVAEGVDAVRTVLRAKQVAHFQSALTRHLRDEVGALGAEDAGGGLAALEGELQRALASRAAGAPLGRTARAWLRVADTLFLEVLAWVATGAAGAAGAAASPGAPRVLPRLLAQLQHAAAARATHASLLAAAAALRSAPGAPGLPATLRQHVTGDAGVSSWELAVPSLPPVTVVLRGVHAYVEGVRTDEPLDMPRAGIEVLPGWLAFWVADSLCKHALLALRSRAAATGWEVASGRRHLRLSKPPRSLHIAGEATQQGSIVWSVKTAEAAPVAISWSIESGKSALDVLAELLN